MDFLIEKALDALWEASGIKEKVSRNERIVRLQQRFGLADVESLTQFDDLYIHAVVTYAFAEDGRLRKPRELVKFFKLKGVRDVFQLAYGNNDPKAWLNKGQEIAQHNLGEQLPEIDPRRELSEFAAVFMGLVKQTRSPKEIRQEQKTESFQRSVQLSMQQLQTQIQQLPSLEAVNQLVKRLAGVATPALPAAAQNSEAAELAHRLGEWFDVLDYDRDSDYEIWEADYFEWIINFPLMRRKFLRILVRGVAGEVGMADLKSFETSMAKVGADQGWLVGNRRVSKVAREIAQAEPAYESITCYTFDELLDEDADFDKYLDWLEEQIKEKGVDVGYLPLACRKDDLDPVTQQKMGVSTYGEADGWIDGYVEMWLDDPAKEHLSVLGEFGTGKTWFSLHYAWVAMQRYREAKRRGTERPRVPIVVPLRDYAKSVTVKSLFSEFFFDKHEMLKSYSVFEKLNRMGKLLLIFDGFDEMAARVNRQSMIDNFWEMAKVVVPGAKAILTCRTEHFPDAIEGRKLFNAELKASLASQTGEPPQFEVLELEKFSDRQIAELMGRKAWPDTVEKVMHNPQLLDLARRPVMVDLILAALPEIEAGKPVDMARVYLYAVTRKMEKDILSDRTFTSLADKLYFLCELSWEMLSTDRMSLNYLDFPARLQQMFAARVKEEKELDHWRYDMMGQTMLIRNSEGDYSPAHRSLLEFFVAYKIVASLGSMAPDFTTVAQGQSHVNEALPSVDYTWDSYFRRECADDGTPVDIAPLNKFAGNSIDELLPLLGQAKLAKVVLDLACPMIDKARMHEHLMPLLWATRNRQLEDIGYMGGNIVQLMLNRAPDALVSRDLSGTNLRGVDLSGTYLQKTNFKDAYLAESLVSKVVGVVNSIAFSPEGDCLAMCDNKGVLQVWNIVTEQVISIHTFTSGPLWSLSFSPDGSKIAVGGSDEVVRLCSIGDDELVRTFNGHSDEVISVSFSPNGEVLATASVDKTVRLWSVADGTSLLVLEAHWVESSALAFSTDGSIVACSTYDNNVALLSVHSGELVHVLKGHSDSVLSVTFSHDDKLLASSSDDSTAKVWSVDSGECIFNLAGHRDGYSVFSVVFNPDRKTLLSCSDDGTIKIWSMTDGKCVNTFSDNGGPVGSMAISPNGQTLASSDLLDENVRLWSVPDGKCFRTIETFSNGVFSVAVSSDGKKIASGSVDNMIKLWSTSSGKCIHMFDTGSYGSSSPVVFSPDCRSIAAIDIKGRMNIWSTVNGECICTMERAFGKFETVSFSPDGQFLALGCCNGDIELRYVAERELAHTFVGYSSRAWCMLFSPDSKLLASANNEGIIVWSVDAQERKSTMPGNGYGFGSIAFSPDSRLVASNENDVIVRLRSILDGNCIHAFDGHENMAWSVAFSPDSQFVATSGGEGVINLWTLEDSEFFCELDGHFRDVYSVIFSSNGQTIVSGSGDETIRLWNIETGECELLIHDRACEGLNITGAVGLTSGQRRALMIMGAVEYTGK